MTQSGGHIEVESRVDVGTTFRVYLPVEERAGQPTSLTPGLALARGRERVLVVDDEGGVRAVAQRILQRAGFEVLAAADGPEALRLPEEQVEPVQLLFTDIVMPGLSGRDLAEQARRRFPGMRVLFASGYKADDRLLDGVVEHGISLLAKPYSPSEPTKKVREALDL